MLSKNGWTCWKKKVGALTASSLNTKTWKKLQNKVMQPYTAPHFLYHRNTTEEPNLFFFNNPFIKTKSRYDSKMFLAWHKILTVAVWILQQLWTGNVLYVVILHRLFKCVGVPCFLSRESLWLHCSDYGAYHLKLQIEISDFGISYFQLDHPLKSDFQLRTSAESHQPRLHNQRQRQCT